MYVHCNSHQLNSVWKRKIWSTHFYPGSPTNCCLAPPLAWMLCLGLFLLGVPCLNLTATQRCTLVLHVTIQTTKLYQLWLSGTHRNLTSFQRHVACDRWTKYYSIRLGARKTKAEVNPTQGLFQRLRLVQYLILNWYGTMLLFFIAFVGVQKHLANAPQGSM